MLKKTIATVINPVKLICPYCGKINTLRATAAKSEIVYCNTCGEVIYENKEIKVGDTPPESGDSE